MVRIFPINELAQRKKLLLIQSDIHRQTMRIQVAATQESIAHLQKKFTVVGLSSVALSVGASVAGLFLAKRKAAASGTGIISKVLSGISAFGQVKSLFKRFSGGSNREENHAE